MFDEYDNLCMGLVRLGEDFEDAAKRLPPVYHQLIKSWDHLSDAAWTAFIEANRQVANDDSWEEWQVHPDNMMCNRFWGRESKAGLDEFMRLAESGFEILEELADLVAAENAPLDATVFLPKTEAPVGAAAAPAYLKWLDAVHETAIGCHTTRLKLQFGNWNEEMATVPEAESDNAVEWMQSCWSDGDSDTSYPLHPLLGSLHHNIMVSSAEAIRIWLGTDEIVPIDIGIEESPIYLPICCYKSESALEALPQGHIRSIPEKPHWDDAKRALFVGDDLIKQYGQPSENQTTVLKVFQEVCWPEAIEDPLPHASDPKGRLNDTIRSLNSHHKTPNVIKFYATGAGEGIRWELQTE